MTIEIPIELAERLAAHAERRRVSTNKAAVDIITAALDAEDAEHLARADAVARVMGSRDLSPADPITAGRMRLHAESAARRRAEPKLPGLGEGDD